MQAAGSRSHLTTKSVCTSTCFRWTRTQGRHLVAHCPNCQCAIAPPHVSCACAVVCRRCDRSRAAVGVHYAGVGDASKGILLRTGWHHTPAAEVKHDRGHELQGSGNAEALPQIAAPHHPGMCLRSMHTCFAKQALRSPGVCSDRLLALHGRNVKADWVPATDLEAFAAKPTLWAVSHLRACTCSAVPRTQHGSRLVRFPVLVWACDHRRSRPSTVWTGLVNGQGRRPRWRSCGSIARLPRAHALWLGHALHRAAGGSAFWQWLLHGLFCDGCVDDCLVQRALVRGRDVDLACSTVRQLADK